MNIKCAVVTVASQPVSGYNIFLKSCSLHGIEPIVLGEGKEFNRRGEKILLLKQFVDNNSEGYSHILFCDAFDVVFVSTLDQILKTYLSMNLPIIFSSERNCWPDQSLEDKYPVVQTPCRFLNSGLWIGEMQAAKKMIDQLALEVLDLNWSDQLLYTKLFLSKRMPISLDYDCKLFQSLYGMSPQDFLWDGAKFKNLITQHFPLIFHGNGHSNLFFVLSKMGLIPNLETALVKAITHGLMAKSQYTFIANIIMSIPNCTLLVVGIGHDADFFYNCSQGNVTFAEDKPEWDPKLPCQTIHPVYEGCVNKWLDKLKIPFEMNSLWDVILVDGPSGYKPNHPGRQESIAWASQFAKRTVFVHDYDRAWERQLCDYYLGSPINLVSSGQNDRLLAVFNISNSKINNCIIDKQSLIQDSLCSNDIAVIISCVNYSDFLKLTLPITKQLFKSITVATSFDDVDTLGVCRDYNVPTYSTDVWYNDGSTFNKAAALNECLNELRRNAYDGWVLFLDADILCSKSFVQDVPNLNKNMLYSVRRRFCRQKDEWINFASQRTKWTDFDLETYPVKNEMVWGRVPTLNPAGLSGYFQLWNIKTGAGAKKLPFSTNAAEYDIEFALSFPDDVRQFIDGHEVLHLGRRGENWDGRVSDQWI